MFYRCIVQCSSDILKKSLSLSLYSYLVQCRIEASYILQQFEVESNKVAAPLMQLCDNSHDEGFWFIAHDNSTADQNNQDQCVFYNIKFAADMVTAGQFGVHLVCEIVWSIQLLCIGLVKT